MCYIRLIVDYEDQEHVEVMIGSLKMYAKRELTKYLVVDDSPVLLQISQHEISMKLVLKRSFTSETMTVFIPSLLLICCSYVTSFFRLPNFFSAAIAANLTVLLTMRTLISDVTKGIAGTSYIKMLEVWLLFCTFIPFVQVILITMIEWLRNKEEIELRERKGESRKEVGFERSTELYEMSVGGRNVKVMNPISIFLIVTQVHPLVTPAIEKDDGKSKVKELLTLGKFGHAMVMIHIYHSKNCIPRTKACLCSCGNSCCKLLDFWVALLL